MRLYVAGPVSGMPGGNRDQFALVSRRLRDAGFEVVNPTEVTDPSDDDCGPGTDRYAEIMERCIRDLDACDGVCTLLGWQHSNGAVLEVQRAKEAGKPVQGVEHWMSSPPAHLKWVGDEECEPVRGYDGDAGFDLTVSESLFVPCGEFVDVPLGISVEMPPGVWGMLTGRSSTIRRRGLLVTQGIIDNGYRGPLYAGVQNLGKKAVRLERGERIAQLILFPLVLPEPVRVEVLSQSDRGELGFGSSGA